MAIFVKKNTLYICKGNLITDKAGKDEYRIKKIGYA